MPLFPDRERAFEGKFALDEENRFKALARRNRMIGRWAAERLGCSGTVADDYIKDISGAIAVADADDVIAAKLMGDFERAGIAASEADIRDKIAEFMAQATLQTDIGGA